MAAEARLTLKVAGASLALPVTAVAEVAALPALTRAPRTPDLLLGVAQHRGRVTPVLSGPALAGSAASKPPACIVVLNSDPPLAVAADAVVSLEAGSDVAPLSPGTVEVEDEAGRRLVDLDAVVAAAFTQLRPQTAPLRTDVAAAKLPGEERVAFLGLRVANQAYALPLDSVLAVGPLAQDLAPTPGADPALLGLEDWRDQVIPVVDLARLLGLSVAGAAAPRLRVVVRLEDRPFGLAVEEVTEVLRAPIGRLAPAPDLFNLGPGEARVSQILRHEGGGLSAILSPEDLLADARRRAWRASAPALAPVRAPSRMQGEPRLIIRIGSERYGLPLTDIEHVAPFPAQLSRPPGAPAELLGVASLRGRPVAVLDAGLLLDAPNRAAPDRLVVIRTRGGLAGLAVQAAEEVAAFEAGDILPAPQLDGLSGQGLPAAVRHGQDLVFLLDPEVLLAQAQAGVIARVSGA